ncbi:hypothetical protein [Haloprofundus salinisoli]|uniref:hypothetical protein n=1 Tax=Haloprofundus salinisoli TaxID=2876193 RepID=UPI001CCC931D|nr:hypothetical protein [Haloprofundus salinisoli]
MTETDSDDGLSLLDERSTTERLRDWVLLRGNRAALSAVVLLGLLLTVYFFVALEVVKFRRLQPVYYVFGGLISGNLTLVTVVVSINQLLLSRALQTPGELESQIESTGAFKRRVEDAAGRVAPVRPTAFLNLLMENTRRDAQRLGGLAVGSGNDDAWEEIDDLVTSVTRHVDSVVDLTENADESPFQALSATLTTNYAEQIHRARTIREQYDLTDETDAALDRLVDRLEDVDIARQYFKTVYLQDELSSLSRTLLYVGVPAEALCILVLLWLTALQSVIPQLVRELVFPVAAVVGLVPLVVLFSYILRTATVTQRTSATIPFTTPKQEA